LTPVVTRFFPLAPLAAPEARYAGGRGVLRAP